MIFNSVLKYHPHSLDQLAKYSRGQTFTSRLRGYSQLVNSCGWIWIYLCFLSRAAGCQNNHICLLHSALGKTNLCCSCSKFHPRHPCQLVACKQETLSVLKILLILCWRERYNTVVVFHKVAFMPKQKRIHFERNGFKPHMLDPLVEEQSMVK